LTLTASTSIEECVVKSLKIFVTLVVLAAACASGSADAGRVRVFVGVGAPFFYPVAPLPYYYPPIVAVPAVPVTYVEQGQPSAGPGRYSGSWYYCDASRAYYPYVKQCPGGWREVSPQPASSR
jgi:hypothetical protein